MIQDEVTREVASVDPLNSTPEDREAAYGTVGADSVAADAQEDCPAHGATPQTPAPQTKPYPYDINNPVQIPLGRFPHEPTKRGLPMTLPNLKFLLDRYRVKVGFDVYKRKYIITVPGLNCPPETADETAHAHIVSLANLHRMQTGPLQEYLAAIASERPFNGPASWITSKPWDGEDRLAAFFGTLKTVDSFPVALKEALMFRWLISLVAAAVMDKGFHSRGVLVLQGRQSMGKTTWFLRLVGDAILRDSYVKTGHHLDPGNKDSLVAAIAHWLVELGELDSSFKKDIARLKGFLTDTADKIRLPYGKREVDFPRRTVFCATVNEDTYLVDPTGNTRFWTIPVIDIDTTSAIDMQQLFAQAHAAFLKGEQWWLTADEERQLEECNKVFRAVSTVRDAIMENFNFNLPREKWKKVTRSGLLKEVGFQNPTNPQSKEAAATLRELEPLIGPVKRSKGVDYYWVPINKDAEYDEIPGTPPDIATPSPSPDRRPAPPAASSS